MLQVTLESVGLEPEQALAAEMTAVTAALQGDTACISGGGACAAARPPAKCPAALAPAHLLPVCCTTYG